MKNRLEEIKEYTAESVYNGFEEDLGKHPVMGEEPDYRKYSGYTDRDIVFRFRDMLPYDDKTLNNINERLNEKAFEYEGECTVCPSCGNHLDLISNDGMFCKFCGQAINTGKLDIGKPLKSLRKRLNKKQAEVAKEIGVSSSRLSHIENGEVPTEREAQALTHALMCSVNEIAGQGRPRANNPSGSGYYFQAYDTASRTPKALLMAPDCEGYESEYIYECPFCHEEVDLSVSEALTLGLDYYEVVRMRSEGNDGCFCKHCGQGLIRPVKPDLEKEFKNYRFWIDRAAE